MARLLRCYYPPLARSRDVFFVANISRNNQSLLITNLQILSKMLLQSLLLLDNLKLRSFIKPLLHRLYIFVIFKALAWINRLQYWIFCGEAGFCFLVAVVCRLLAVFASFQVGAEIWIAVVCYSWLFGEWYIVSLDNQVGVAACAQGWFRHFFEPQCDLWIDWRVIVANRMKGLF